MLKTIFFINNLLRKSVGSLYIISIYTGSQHLTIMLLIFYCHIYASCSDQALNSNLILTINTRNTPSAACVAKYLQPLEKTHFLTSAGCLNDATLILRDSIFVKSLQRVILAPSALLAVSKYFLVKRRKTVKNRGKFQLFSKTFLIQFSLDGCPLILGPSNYIW